MGKTLADLRHLALRLREMSPALLEEAKTLVRHPRSLGLRLEEASPWLNRQFLGAASNIAEPFLLGMGLTVERLEEETIQVRLPGYWLNQGDGGVVHTGALTALGEFTTRLFWEHHLDLRHSDLTVKRIETRILAPGKGGLKALYGLSVAEREEILQRLRAEACADVQCLATIYDHDGRLVAEIEIDWRLTKTLALGSTSFGSSSSKGS